MNSQLALAITISAIFSDSTFAQESSNLELTLANSQRPIADRKRDENRKPLQVSKFFDVEKGDSTLDVIAMGGWYSEVLSHIVGDRGVVFMHNNPIPITERSAAERAERTARLSNVEDFIGSVSDIPANSIDFAITALNFHDVYNRSPADADKMLKEIFKALKPDGILGIIDHEGSDNLDNSALHRITFKKAVQASIAAGFILTDTSNLLENLKDDHTLSPFDDQIKGRTDRFILKLAKK